MGETRVDLHHLLEDLRDAYPGSLEETIVTEIVANALDSGATTISFTTDRENAVLTVVDNGRGMSRRELRSYHDLAATTKTRGSGIGFAGVGMKLGLLACESVTTETRRGKTHIATTWRLSSRRRAPWSWIKEPEGLVSEHGTAIRLWLGNPLSELLDSAALEGVIATHFATLLDLTFAEILAKHYPEPVEFYVDGRRVRSISPPAEAAFLSIKVGRRRKPTAKGYMYRNGDSPDAGHGLAISTLGKVIRRGWDWVGVSPADSGSVSGIIEVPPLAECLTLNKADFIRTGERGALFLAHRGAIQQAVQAQLVEWGGDDARERDRLNRKARPLERDIENVLADLASDYPLLASLVERHRGGQRRLPMGGSGKKGALIPEAPVRNAEEGTDEHVAKPTEDHEPAPSSPPAPPLPNTGEPGRRNKKRPARYALTIRFEERPDDPSLGRLLESTVLVNQAHPAYKRSERTRAVPYHIALTVAMTLAPLAVEAEFVHDFVTEFLARWGSGDLVKKKGKRRKKRG